MGVAASLVVFAVGAIMRFAVKVTSTSFNIHEVGVILMIIAAMLTSLTIAREWENGTMEQLLSTPVRPVEMAVGKLSAYFLLGIVVMLISLFVGMVVFAALVALSAAISRRFVPAFIILGYVASWMMWVPGNERRVLFFYHALGMLLFTALALAYALSAIRRVKIPFGGREVSLAPVAYAVIASVLAAFIFFYPIWTAMPQSSADQQMRVWVDSG